jgi:hypothetical protein
VPKQNVRTSVLKWHRWLTVILSVQLAIWLCTALGMALVPRAAITSYKMAPTKGIDAAANFPELSALAQAIGPGARAVTFEQIENRPLVQVSKSVSEDEKPLYLDPKTLLPAKPMSTETVLALAKTQTRQNLSAQNLSVVERNNLEYQKLPVPAFRVETPKAKLFYDPITGKLLTQTNGAKLFENLVTTIHVMDWTGKAQFRQNLFLSFFATLFLSAALLGVLAVRRVYFTKGIGLVSLRLHQGLGLLLATQVVFWVTSGLGVVWALKPLKMEAESRLNEAFQAIDWDAVKVAPQPLVAAGAPGPVRVTLTMLLGKPVYQAQWAGRAPKQALWSAQTGAPIILSLADRDAIARSSLKPDSAVAIERWEVAKSPKDLDFYFYTGPYPVWKGFFTKPMSGAVSIDQVTGLVHAPRTDREIFLERYYNLHVVNWRFGVVKYRQEPLLLIMIGLAMVLFGTGAIMQLRRWKNTQRKAT